MSQPLRRAIIVTALMAALLLLFIPAVSSAQLARLFIWSPRSDAPLDRVEGVGALIGARLYVFSGFLDSKLRIARQVDLYDLATDTWTPAVSEMPGSGVTHVTPAVDGTAIWIAGGFVGDHPGPTTADVWRYDSLANQWLPGPALPEPRAAGGLVRLGRQLHYFGGFAFRDTREQLDNTRASHWTLDLDNPAAAWQPAEPLPEPLGHLSGLTLDGKIYAIGGQIRHDRDSQDLASVYVYDPAHKAWEARASLPTPRSHAEPGTFAFNGRIVVVGGRNNTTISGPSEMNQVVMYDPASDLWLDLPRLPFTRIAPIAVPFGEQIIVTNGGLYWDEPQRLSLSGSLAESWETEHAPAPLAPGAALGAIVGRRMFVLGATISETLAFDLSLGAWEPAATHPARPLVAPGQAMESHAGRLYVFGGAGEAAQTLQIYDPVMGEWSAGAELPFAALDAAAISLGAAIYLVSAEGAARYLPASNSWEPIAAAPVAVRAAAAGSDATSMYLFGGRDASGPLDVVQRYSPADNTWTSSRDPATTLIALPEPRAEAGRALCAGGRWYLFGGVGSDGKPLAAAVVFDRSTAEWRPDTVLPKPRAAAALALIADRMYMAGGLDADGMGIATLDVYNLAPPTPTGVSPTATTMATKTATLTATATATASSTPTVCPTPGSIPVSRLFFPFVRR